MMTRLIDLCPSPENDRAIIVVGEILHIEASMVCRENGLIFGGFEVAERELAIQTHQLCNIYHTMIDTVPYAGYVFNREHTRLLSRIGQTSPGMVDYFYHAESIFCALQNHSSELERNETRLMRLSERSLSSFIAKYKKRDIVFEL